MPRQLLPLIPPGLLVREVLASSDGLTIVATCAGRAAACPDCGARSGVVHSRYERRLQDLPWQGRPVTLRIQARRLRCNNIARGNCGAWIRPVGAVCWQKASIR